MACDLSSGRLEVKDSVGGLKMYIFVTGEGYHL